MRFVLLLLFSALMNPVAGAHQELLSGEKISYTMYFQGIPVAHAEMSCQWSDSLCTLSWHADTFPVFDLVYPIHNTYVTKVDPQSRQPLHYHKVIKQRNVKQNWQVCYNWEKLKATSDHGYQWHITAEAHNFMSMLFHLRTSSLQINDSLVYTLDVEDQLWTLHGSVSEAKNEKNLPGSFKNITFHFDPLGTVQDRRWDTDLLTHRFSSPETELVIVLGPEPYNIPYYISFIGKKGQKVEMKWKDYTNESQEK